MTKLNILSLAYLRLHFETVFWLAITIAVLAVALHLETLGWYSNSLVRSGTVVALIGAFASYRDYQGRLSSTLFKLANRPDLRDNYYQVFEDKDKIERNTRYSEILIVLVGAIISGFGDLMI